MNVKFDLRGREYNGQYYVDLNAWRIERGDQTTGPDAVEDSSLLPSVRHRCLRWLPMPAAAPADDDDLPVLILHGGPIQRFNLERALDAYARGFQRWLPSPFTIAVMLTVVAALMALRQASAPRCWMRGRQAFGMPA